MLPGDRRTTFILPRCGGSTDDASRTGGGQATVLDEVRSTTADDTPMNAAAAPKCLALPLHQDMALVQMYGKDELFSLPNWKVLHLYLVLSYISACEKGKSKNVDLYSTQLCNASQKRSRCHVLKRSQVSPATHTFIHEWNEPFCLYSQPQIIIALWPVLVTRPTEGRKLSWPGWLVTYRGGMPTRRRSPIPVPTDR